MPAMRTGNGRNQIRADLRFLPEGQTVEAKAAFQLMREEVFFSVKAHGIENADDIGCLLRQIHMNLFSVSAADHRFEKQIKQIKMILMCMRDENMTQIVQIRAAANTCGKQKMRKLLIKKLA